MPIFAADVELLRWDMTLREVQHPLSVASKTLAKAMWPGDKLWPQQLKALLKSEIRLWST